MIQTMTAVWQSSRAKGGTLIVALALADYANKNGIAYPSLETLAKKARLGRRQVMRAIEVLEQLGELEVRRRQGPNHVHVYKVTICHSDKLSPETSGADVGDIMTAEQVSSMSPNPSGTVKEPSSLARDNFQRFWDNYPPRKGVKQHKQKGEQAFLKMTPVEQERLTSAASRYRRHCDSTQSYAVDAHRFISDGLWRDYWLQEETKRPPPSLGNNDPPDNVELTEDKIEVIKNFRNKHALSFPVPGEEGTPISSDDGTPTKQGADNELEQKQAETTSCRNGSTTVTTA